MDANKQIMVCVGGVWQSAMFDRWNVGIVLASGEWRNLGSLDAFSYDGEFCLIPELMPA